MNDYGIIISNKDAKVQDLSDTIYNTKYPTAKLDTTNPISFSDLTLTFNNDPPEPGVPGTLRTTVAAIPHGYVGYIPSFWALYNVVNAPTAAFYEPYFQEQGALSIQNVGADIALLDTRADATNINIQVNKVRDVASSPNPLTGFIVKIRLYVFAEDLGI